MPLTTMNENNTYYSDSRPARYAENAETPAETTKCKGYRRPN